MSLLFVASATLSGPVDFLRFRRNIFAHRQMHNGRFSLINPRRRDDRHNRVTLIIYDTAIKKFEHNNSSASNNFVSYACITITVKRQRMCDMCVYLAMRVCACDANDSTISFENTEHREKVTSQQNRKLSELLSSGIQQKLCVCLLSLAAAHRSGRIGSGAKSSQNTRTWCHFDLDSRSDIRRFLCRIARTLS